MDHKNWGNDQHFHHFETQLGEHIWYKSREESVRSGYDSHSIPAPFSIFLATQKRMRRDGTEEDTVFEKKSELYRDFGAIFRVF